MGQYNSQEVMDREIDVASSHGIDFFQILWYSDYPSERAPGARFLNRGVQTFMNSTNASKMRFCIEYCNALPLFGVHDDQEWETMIRQDWLPAFRHPSYLRVGGNLVFKVHSAPAFKQNCSNSRELVTKRLNLLRDLTRAEGLGEVIIGGGSGFGDISDPDKRWGYPYNFTNFYGAVAHDDPSFQGQILPWANESAFVREGRAKVRKAALQTGDHSFVPNVMSGWDPRPWHERRASYIFPTAEEWDRASRYGPGAHRRAFFRLSIAEWLSTACIHDLCVE